MEIEVGERICTVEYDYPTFHLIMHCYMASLLDGNIALLEHKAARWLTKSELDEVEWLPADVEVVERLRVMV